MSVYLLDFGDIVYAGSTEAFELPESLAIAKRWFAADDRADGFVGWEVTSPGGIRPTQHATKPDAVVELKARAAERLREVKR